MMRHARRQLIAICVLGTVILSVYLMLLDKKRLVRNRHAEEDSFVHVKLQEKNNSISNNINTSVIVTHDAVNVSQTVEQKTVKPINVEIPIVTNLSCVPRYALTRMKAHYSKFNENQPVFISPGFTSWDSRIMQFQPPFGLNGQETVINHLLQSMTDSSLPASITQSNGCKLCVIVGSGGVLREKKLGKLFDQYDVVFRINSAPVRGYESMVGNKTTIRVAYPEAAPKTSSGYDRHSLFSMVAFKAKDLEWLQNVIHDKAPPSKGFWTKIALSLPKRPEQVRLVNPMLVRETAFDLLGYPTNQGRMSKNVPTTGTIAIVMALRFCDEVHVAGFGYQTNNPEAYLHYYENTKMKSIPSLFTHNLSQEKLFLRKLVEKGVIKDLTGGIHMNR
ncbi:CMP-N-acetylneuraminate-beta-1,4-galactoside alpha-2,3-sialyltransferase-like isoform X2 [Ptychodera flava]